MSEKEMTVDYWTFAERDEIRIHEFQLREEMKRLFVMNI
jgi:hypothetical protein